MYAIAPPDFLLSGSAHHVLNIFCWAVVNRFLSQPYKEGEPMLWNESGERVLD